MCPITCCLSVPPLEGLAISCTELVNSSRKSIMHILNVPHSELMQNFLCTGKFWLERYLSTTSACFTVACCLNVSPMRWCWIFALYWWIPVGRVLLITSMFSSVVCCLNVLSWGCIFALFWWILVWTILKHCLSVPPWADAMTYLLELFLFSDVDEFGNGYLLHGRCGQCAWLPQCLELAFINIFVAL